MSTDMHIENPPHPPQKAKTPRKPAPALDLSGGGSPAAEPAAAAGFTENMDIFEQNLTDLELSLIHI